MPKYFFEDEQVTDSNKHKESIPVELLVDERGRLTLPEKILQMWNITRETKFSISLSPEGLLLKRTDPPLTKVYIEPTNACNLSCRTCVRNSWSEPTGMMNMETYQMAKVDTADLLRKALQW